MDYNKFEDRISSWIEGDLDLKDRKEFEAFLAENPEYQSKVDEVRNIISRMRESDSLKLSEEFDKKLAEKIDSLNVGVTDKKSNDIFGFSRQNFAYLTLSLGAILFLIFQFPANSFDVWPRWCSGYHPALQHSSLLAARERGAFRPACPEIRWPVLSG